MTAAPGHADPAVRILRLSLAGFGIYEQPSHFRFPAGPGIVAGPNETGKSTLLNGLAAVWFGLPSESSPSRFGSARFRSFSRPRDFWGEAEWERAGHRFILHRSFDTHRVRLIRQGDSGNELLFEGEHNPRATSSAGSAFRALLQEHLGISDLDLFLQTFCMSQPLPDETAIGAELQHLLSGSRSGRVDDVLQRLFLQVKDLTKGTGDLGLVRPGATRPQNQKESGRIELLEAGLANVRKELGEGRDVLERLNAHNERLEKTQAGIAETREKRELAKRRADVLRRWLDLNEERRTRHASMQQAQKALDELSAAKQELAALEPGLTGRLAAFAGAGPGLAQALEALEKAAAARERTEQMLTESEADAARLDGEARALKQRLTVEFASVQGRPGLLALRTQAEEAGRRRQARASAIADTESRLDEAKQRLDSLTAWEGVRPDLLRPEVEAILSDVRSLESMRNRLAEIDRQSGERSFLSSGRLESLRSRIELEERHRILASRLKDIEREHGFSSSLLGNLEEERSAKENEIRLLQEQLARDFPGYAGRQGLPATAGRLGQARARRGERRGQIRSLEDDRKALEEASAAAGESAGLDPAALRRDAEEIVRDISSIETIDGRLQEIEGQTRGREFLEGGRLEQLRETISCRDQLRENSLKIRELELDQIRRKHEAAGRREEAPVRHRGPISIWLSVIAGIALGAGLHYGLDRGLPASAGIGAGLLAVLQILNALLRRRGAGRIARAATEPVMDDGQADSLRNLRIEQARLEQRLVGASDDLGPFAATTGPELARMEERWSLLDTEAERLRRERSGLLARRFGIDDGADWRALKVSELRPGLDPLLRIPGAPTEGSVLELGGWLKNLDPQVWSGIEEDAAGLGERRQRASEIDRDLARLLREDEADTEVEDLTRQMHPLPPDTGVEEIEKKAKACAALEQRLAALQARLQEIPDAEELRRQRNEADEQLARLWAGVTDAWPEAPEAPSPDLLRDELGRLESDARLKARDLGPYERTTRSELAALEEKWRILDEESVRLRDRESEILTRRFGVAGSRTPDPAEAQAGTQGAGVAIRWESLPAADLASPFDEVLRLPGAPAGSTAGDLVGWLRDLDPDAWAEFQRTASRRREYELGMERLQRDLERLQKEHGEDRDLEKLAAELAPFTPETPAEEISALLDGCRECEKALHAVLEKLKSIPGSEARAQTRTEAAQSLEQSWDSVESAWPGARGRASGKQLDTWLTGVRAEEQASRAARQKAAAIDERVQTILRTAGAGSRSALEAQRDEANAVLGQVVLRIQEVERQDPFLAASRDETDPMARARSLQAEADRLGEESESLREAIDAAEQEERDLLRALASLEGAVPPNIARVEIRIRHMEEDLVRLRRERDALALAYRWVREAADTFQAAYREDLEARVTEHFRALTGADGRRVRLDEEFACRVIDAAGTALAPEQLSQGARDQLALSIRLAVADLLTQAVPLPIFFDDPFVHYDTGRLRNLQETLKAVAAERQWLLLTHRSDLAEWADPVVVEAG